MPGAKPARPRPAHALLGRLGKPLDLGDPEVRLQQALTGDREADTGDEGDRERNGPRRSEVGEATGPAGRPLAARPPGPEHALTEDRHQGRDERDRNPQRDEDGQRHSRAEGAEELELARDEGGRAAGDDQARGDDDRQVLSGRPVGGVEPFVARVEALPHPVQEEHRIVRDHAEQEYDENRLGVARDGDAAATRRTRPTLEARRRRRFRQRRASRAGTIGERKCTPRISAITRNVARVTQGRPSSISRHSCIRAGTAPVTPTTRRPRSSRTSRRSAGSARPGLRCRLRRVEEEVVIAVVPGLPRGRDEAAPFAIGSANLDLRELGVPLSAISFARRATRPSAAQRGLPGSAGRHAYA